jgi:hypothetical protein
MARELNCIDIDDIGGTRADMHHLIHARRRLVFESENAWEEHNRKWTSIIREVLTKMWFDTPQVVFLHTEEHALKIGARPIIALLPNKKIHRVALQDRGSVLAVKLGEDNWEVVKRRTLTCPLIEFDEWWEVEAYSTTAVFSVCEIPKPFKYLDDTIEIERDAECWPLGYDLNCPDWVLRGKIRTIDDIVEVNSLFEKGMVPRACLEYYEQMLCGMPSTRGVVRLAQVSWMNLIDEYTVHLPKPQAYDFRLVDDYEKFFPYESNMARNRRNIGLRAFMREGGYSNWHELNEILNYHIGDNQNYVTSLMIYVIGVIPRMRKPVQEAIMRSKILCLPGEEFKKYAKKAHDLIRQTGQIFGIPITPEERSMTLYWHVLFGRQLYEIDEDVEVEKRQKKLEGEKKALLEGVWTWDNYLKLLNEGIEDAYSRMRAKVNINAVTNFMDFWKRRRQWAAKGSTVLHEGEKKYVLKLVDHVHDEIERRHNKKSLFENEETLCDILWHIINEYGRNDTRQVPKWESAAERVLLPGNLYHYVVFSFVLQAFEYDMEVGNVRLNVMRDDDFAMFDIRMGERLKRFEYDFADFNSQHSKTEMKMVISKLAECGVHSDELRWALGWMARSFDQMVIRNKDGSEHRIESGLYSGWRGTTWINSVLNHAYIYVVRRCYEQIRGCDDVWFYEGCGDDVDMMTRTATDWVLLYSVCCQVGLKAQEVKQLFGERGEFLRITYEAGKGYGSICRLLGNYVSGNWEGEGADMSQNLIAAITNIDILERRGLDPTVCRILYRCAIKHWGRIKEMGEWKQVSPFVIHGMAEQGGMGIPDWQGRVWRLKEPVPKIEGSDIYIKLPAVSATKDYADEINKELQRYGMEFKIDQAGLEKMAEDSYEVQRIRETFGEKFNAEEWKKFWFFETEIEERVDVLSTETAPALSADFLAWVNAGARAQYYDEYKRYLQYSALKDYIYIGDQKADLRGIFGAMTDKYDKLSRKKGSVQLGMRCPSYIQSNVRVWASEMYLSGQISLFQIDAAVRKVCNTLGGVYAHMF